MIGGIRVIFLKPSQLNPSNHLRFRGKQYTFISNHWKTVNHFQMFTWNMSWGCLTCAFGCPWHHFSNFLASPMDCPCDGLHILVNTCVSERPHRLICAIFSQDTIHTCIVSWLSCQHSWWSSLEILSCQYLSEWYCMSSLDQDQKKVDYKKNTRHVSIYVLCLSICVCKCVCKCVCGALLCVNCV